MQSLRGQSLDEREKPTESGKNYFSVLYESPKDIKWSVGWVDFDKVGRLDESTECFRSTQYQGDGTRSLA